MSLRLALTGLGARRASALAAIVVVAAACTHPAASTAGGGAMQAGSLTMAAPSPDPRVGLKPGLWDAGQAEWNVKLVSTTRPSEKFLGQTNSDLAFSGPYAIQGSYNGYQIWDISNPAHPTLKVAYYCPASQSDVSVYKNLLFVSAEAGHGAARLRRQGVSTTGEHGPHPRHPHLRHHGHRATRSTSATCRRAVGRTRTRCSSIRRIQTTCTSTSRARPAPRSAEELTGCSNMSPSKDPNSPLFRIEVIKVPLAHPEKAAIVSSPRIFNDLTKPATHGQATADVAEHGRGARERHLHREGLRYRLPAAGKHDQAADRQHRQAPRRSGDGGRQRRAARVGSGPRRQDDRPAAGEPERRPDAVPRHHGVSGGRLRRWRVRRLRPAARHPRPGASRARRRGRGFQLLILALGDVQQRRHESAVQRRVGRRWRAEVPRAAIRSSGAPTRSSRSTRTTRCISRATTRCPRRRRRRRTASPTTAR